MNQVKIGEKNRAIIGLTIHHRIIGPLNEIQSNKFRDLLES